MVVVSVEVLVDEVEVDEEDVVLLVVVFEVVDVDVVVVVTQISEEFFTVNITQYESDCNFSLIN